jgi:hypothetical protein
VRPLLQLLTCAWAAFGFFAWVLRDGLGPDSTESRGFEAITRMFWTFWWGPVGVVLLGLWLLVARRSPHDLPPAN